MDRRQFHRVAAFSPAAFMMLARPTAQAQAPAQSRPVKSTIQISISSVLVADQDKALAFYTDVLGFVKKQDIPLGEARWLTVVSPQVPDGVELLLEPTNFAPAKTYQKAVFDAGIPLTAFEVTDLAAEHDRLVKQGVQFRSPPTKAGPVSMAVLDDTCGNLIQLYQRHAEK